MAYPPTAAVGRRPCHVGRRRAALLPPALLLLLLLLLSRPPAAFLVVLATDFEVGISTLSDVDSISRIAYDVRDMAESIENGDWPTARRIYEYGKNSVQYDSYGNEMDDLLSLRAMARAGGSSYAEDPSYLFHVYGLSDADESIASMMGRRGAYADEYVMDVLNDYDSGTLGAQASTVLIVSMYAYHVLWRGLLDCVARREGYDAGAVGGEGGGGGGVGGITSLDPRRSFDEFVALYVGAGQTLAPDWDGDMLYELAQAGGDRFGTVDTEGEAIANSDVKLRYQEIQRLLTGDDYCTRDDQIESLWRSVNYILSRMHVPLVQMLVHSLKTEDQADKVRMYSLALVPQLSQCRPLLHRKLKEYLLDREYDMADFPRILDLLQQSYDCLGIKCSDVGAHKDDDGVVDVAECADYEKSHPLVGFIPTEDVRTLSKVDLDILALDQLLKFPSTTNHQMAQLYYKYGKAAVLDESGAPCSTMSLRGMIKSIDQRRWSPYYEDYVAYFEDPPVFANASMRADETIMAAFNGTGVASIMTPDQRGAYIVSLVQNNVVPEFMMGLLGLAVQVCRDADNDASPTLYLDAFAALYIGSLEGIKQDDFDDGGLMMWALAENRARNFNTQTDGFLAIINEEMMDMLFAGQSELERRDCDNFDKTFSRVLHLLLLPLIQSTIWYAIRNEGAATTDKDVAIGQAMALSVLPIVQKYHPDDASVIERNMIMVNGTPPVLEGPQMVASAFYKTLKDVGWGCEYVGQAEGIDACDKSSSNAKSVLIPSAFVFISAMWSFF